MHQAKQRLLVNAAKMMDIVVLLFCFCAVTINLSALTTTNMQHFLSMRIRLGNFLIWVGIVIVWHYVLELSGLYMSKRLSTRRSKLIDVVQATSVVAGFLYLAGMLFHLRLIKPTFVLFFWILSSLLLAGGRLAIWIVLGKLRMRGLNPRFVLIVGTNARAIRFASSIEGRPELGYRVVGFVDSDWANLNQLLQTGNQLCCDLSALPEFLRHRVVDEVAIFLPLRSCYEAVADLSSLCEQYGILIRFDTEIFDLKVAKSQADDIDGTNQFSAATDGQHAWQSLLKRVQDILISLLLLMLLLPLFLVIAVAIRLTSKGPVFFQQTRVGLNKRFFKMHKFRTMVVDAEERMPALEQLNEIDGPVFKIKSDPRITPIGKLLRRTSVDELPQLLNILIGDMSLVGPRPLPLRDYQGFNQDWQRRRFSVRPGLTCLWQINGRSQITFEQWMKMDIQYLDEWSFWLDLKILARTIPAVLRGTGAE